MTINCLRAQDSRRSWNLLLELIAMIGAISLKKFAKEHENCIKSSMNLFEAECKRHNALQINLIPSDYEQVIAV